MPELPEVEHLRRSLEPSITHAVVRDVAIHRRDMVRLPVAVKRTTHEFEQGLLMGTSIVATHRRGKQLALEGANGRVLVIQLGMSGSVIIERGAPPREIAEGMAGKHRHVVWTLETPPRAGTKSRSHESPHASLHESLRMAFRDPRRFGGLTAFGSLEELHAAWAALGPDALTVTAQALRAALLRSKRAVKSVLLDQALVAGVGNIYADEALFAARIHPETPANIVEPAAVGELARAIRAILRRAVNAGGSTIRDYKDALGRAGTAATSHQVYGRAGQPCFRCHTTLEMMVVQARTTVFCRVCQPTRHSL